MNYGIILAAVNGVSNGQENGEIYGPVNYIWEQITSLSILEALTFISFGTVCLFYGWRVFKILVIISFSLIGLILGIMASDKMLGGENQIIAGLIGMGGMAALSVPLMRWAVSLLGAVSGGIITAALWYAFNLPEVYIWAGALIGIVAGGMISFIIFRISIMLFSSLGGGVLMVTGLLALLYLYPETTDQVQSIFYENRWFLPIALLVPTAIGVAVQNKFIKTSPDWKL